MNIKKIIYWHRFGVKIYDVSNNSNPVLEKEIESTETEKIKSELKYISNQKIFLLLSDSISYLYEKIIDPPLVVDNLFKENLLNIIKSDIPEDFYEFVWDYKIEDTSNNKQKVLIFAPVKEFYKVINQITIDLGIKIDAIETESMASQRDPNPILGMIKKTDINGKDKEILNLSIIPEKYIIKSVLKKIIIPIFIVFITILIFFIIKNKYPISINNPNVNPIIVPTISVPLETPTIEPTITPKAWSDLNILVENGTKITGLASKTALIFKKNGINQVKTGNANNNNYISSQLIFKSDLLKQTYQDKFKSIVNISNEDIKVDNLIEYDVIFITI